MTQPRYDETIYFICTDCPEGGRDQIEKPNEHIEAHHVLGDHVTQSIACPRCGKPMVLLDPERSAEILRNAREHNERLRRELGY